VQYINNKTPRHVVYTNVTQHLKKKFWKISSLVILTLISCGTQYLNYNSDSLKGKYLGIEEPNGRIELRLMENNEFKFWIRKGHSSDFTQGTWRNLNNTLTLNSKVLNSSDSLTFLLTSAKWIVFQNTEWIISNENQIELHSGEWKLKKEAD